MNIGAIYYQAHNGLTIYVMPTRQLKGGGYAGLMYRHYDGSRAGKAVNHSLQHMHPAPIPSEDGTPGWILDKFREAQK